MTLAETTAPAFEHLVLDFLAELEFERGLSRNTLEAYRSDLLQFGGCLERTGADALTATHSDLAGFLSELATGGASPATLQRKAACLRSFYRHLRREGTIEHDPTADLRAPKKTQRLPHVLSRDEIARLLRRRRPPPAGRPARARPAVAARPRAARAHVRVRPARLGGDRAAAARRRPRGRLAARPWQRLQGPRRPGGVPGGSRRGGGGGGRRRAARACARAPRGRWAPPRSAPFS